MAKKAKKVLIIDHGSAYTKKIEETYKAHPDIDYQTEIKSDEEVRELSEKELGEYDIIHLSGSRVKKNLNDEISKYILKSADPGTYVIGTCYGAQVIAQHHGVEPERLKQYQKGKQKISYKNQEAHIHKEHRWGIPVKGDSESKLEKIASSKQKFHKAGDAEIYEVFKAKDNPRHIGIQGHAEQGIGKEIIYDILNEIHK